MSTLEIRGFRLVRKPARPRVALVSDAVYPYFRGGKEIRYYEIAQRLARRADVSICTMKWWAGARKVTENEITFRAVSPQFQMYVGERRSYREAILFAIGCLRLLWLPFDVLEADQFPYFHILVLRLITWLRGKRLVVTWHEVWGRGYWHEYVGKAGSAAWFIEWLAMRVPDHLIAASPQTAERLRATLGDRARIAVVPNGIDLDAIRSSYPDPDGVDIVTVGRLLPHKNVGMLLEAVASLHAAGEPVTCRVIGDGPQSSQLHNQAKLLGIEHAVDFRHDVWEQKDVYALMKSAKVAVFPTAREGFGIAVLEAIACGLPVVTTSAPDNLARHLVDRSADGVVCVPSTSAIAASVSQLLDSRAAVDHVVPSDEEWLEESSWDSAADKIAEVLGL
jgi:glycosyltransferase involved in cell wall biosynthesis